MHFEITIETNITLKSGNMCDFKFVFFRIDDKKNNKIDFLRNSSGNKLFFCLNESKCKIKKKHKEKK